MFKNLKPEDKKALKIAGAIAAVGLLAFGIKKLIDNNPELPEDPNAGSYAPGLPSPSDSGTTNNPTVVQAPPAERWNVNTALCYKSPYTRMVKVLQSAINQIAVKYKHYTIDVDGKFGNDTLKKVRAYFGTDCVNLDTVMKRLQEEKNQINFY